MIFDVPARGTLRLKTKEDIKKLIENMCQNKYFLSECAIKQKGIHAVDLTTTLYTQIKELTKQFATAQLA